MHKVFHPRENWVFGGCAHASCVILYVGKFALSFDVDCKTWKVGRSRRNERPFAVLLGPFRMWWITPRRKAGLLCLVTEKHGT